MSNDWRSDLAAVSDKRRKIVATSWRSPCLQECLCLPMWKALSSTPTTAADAPWDPYPWKWGKNAIADSPDAALKWWLDQLTNNAVSDSDPSVVLTDEEISSAQSDEAACRLFLVRSNCVRGRRMEEILDTESQRVGRIRYCQFRSAGAAAERKGSDPADDLSKSQSRRPDVFRLDAVQRVHEAVPRPRHRDRRHRQPAVGLLSGERELRVRRCRELRGARQTDLRA